MQGRRRPPHGYHALRRLRRAGRQPGAAKRLAYAAAWPILERAVLGKILTHLGLDPQPPPRSKAGEAGLEFAA